MMTTITAYSQLKEGKKNIESLCGCFEVEFKYAETFSPDTAYKFHERETINGGTEYIFPVVNTDKRLVLQHLLVVTDSIIVKHWREEWTYENPVIWNFTGNKTWVKKQLAAAAIKDSWTQAVWEVSDAPRYQGLSRWLNLDGKTIWQNTTDAPLPRREYSIRHDYNILRRENRLSINSYGWLHDQYNQKIIRSNGTDKLLVEEKGINTYKKIDMAACNAAKAYWEKNSWFWTKVRTTWENYTASHSTIKLKEQDRPMHDYFFTILEKLNTKNVTETEIDGKLKEIFNRFLEEDKPAAAK